MHQAELSRFSDELHATKYRGEGETFSESQARMASAISDDEEHFYQMYEILNMQRFMGGGRTQQSLGTLVSTTPMNFYVSSTIEDSFESIMGALTEAGETMRKGGGIGYDFSLLRPRGTHIASLGSAASGPVSFMQVFDAMCKTVSSAGHRRGAQMGVLRVDHPDIEEFIRAKHNSTNLTAFNISVGITDEFMEAVISGDTFTLKWNGQSYSTVNAANLWELIMRSSFDWAEPGVLFLDRINQMNNLYWCEEIASTNPCGEQPLPPNGACLLGSFNLTKYVIEDVIDTKDGEELYYSFNYDLFKRDVPIVVRAMDNVHEQGNFPLQKQALESSSKRRMGLGVTGLANAIEVMGYPYGSEGFLIEAEKIFTMLRDECYLASSLLAKEKGSFPLYDPIYYLAGGYVTTLPDYIIDSIKENGIRNFHLLSIAPTDTISLCANNISGGIEPIFNLGYTRTIQTEDGPVYEDVTDYAFKQWGVEGKVADECTADEHLAVLALASRYVDSAVSKTINVSGDIPWAEFKDIYIKAWQEGCKGCTTFNKDGKRYGVLNATVTEGVVEAQACYVDLETGQKECS